MNRHKHVEWDDPGNNSVLKFYERDPQDYVEPHPGSIITAIYEGFTVRVRVEAFVDGDTSIGEVVALINPRSGERKKTHSKLEVGDMVRVPDAMRSMDRRDPDGENKH